MCMLENESMDTKCGQCMASVMPIGFDPSEGEGPFESFKDYQNFAAAQPDEMSCKLAEGHWVTRGNGRKSYCKPRKAKHLKCKKTEDPDFCVRIGCNYSATKKRCFGVNAFRNQ